MVQGLGHFFFNKTCEPEISTVFLVRFVLDEVHPPYLCGIEHEVVEDQGFAFPDADGTVLRVFFEHGIIGEVLPFQFFLQLDPFGQGDGLVGQLA